MFVLTTPLAIEKKEQNRVKSSNVFLRHSVRQDMDNLSFDEDGLFSDKIFGEIDRCKCGALTKPGFCRECNQRVVSSENLPDFYIDVKTRLPKYGFDRTLKVAKKQQIIDLLEFNAFLVEDSSKNLEVINKKRLDMTNLKKGDKVYLGVDAALKIKPELFDWCEKFTTSTISVPHRKFRPLIETKKGISLSLADKALVEVLEEIERVESFEQLPSLPVKIASLRAIYKSYVSFCEAIYSLFAQAKGSFVETGMRSHSFCRASKAVIVNRHDVEEDIAVIGDNLIPTLYPHLVKEYLGNMKLINNHFIREGEIVLLNRAPSLSDLSILAFSPRVASCLPPLDSCEGDEDVDTIGKNTIGINPIVCSGFAGDFDGDTMLCIPLYSTSAKKEAEKLSPKINYQDSASGKLKNGIPFELDYLLDDEANIERKDRARLIEEYRNISDRIFLEEKLPQASDLLSFAKTNKSTSKLKKVFEYFDNEEKLHETLVLKDRDSLKISEEESQAYVADVVAANKTEVAESGTMYKKLMAAGDPYRISKEDCKSEGRFFNFPRNEEEFIYNFRDCAVEVKKNTYRYYRFYEDFLRDFKKENNSIIKVRTPLSCKELKRGACCKRCAGKLKEGIKNLGLYAALVVTENATQGALSSMNQGKSVNMNKVLLEDAEENLDWKDFLKWTESLLVRLKSDKVERRFFEMCLAGRVKFLRNGEIKVFSLKNPTTRNIFGDFLYSSSLQNFMKIVTAEGFKDTSLKLELFVESGAS